MMTPDSKGVSRWTTAIMFFAISLGLGCEQSDGPAKYTVSGMVSHASKPVAVGDIKFEPLEGTVNKNTIAMAYIRDGQYRVEIVGGPHRIAVRDLSGSIEDSPTKPQFHMEYYTQAELPAANDVDGTHAFDITVPESHK